MSYNASGGDKMDRHRAIPPGFMTVGEVAKKMGITVRALQYYDREGLLSPSALSEGGRRLYADKDVVRLHQILSMKHLGFSLADIKDRLPSLDTPLQVAEALKRQAAAIREKLEALSASMRAIEALRAEVLKMQTVDFKKYADIIVNLQMKNEFYWLIKYFDEETLDHIRSRFDRESGRAFLETFLRLSGEAEQLQAQGAPPDGEAAQALAQAYWEMVLDFTGGDTGMLLKLMEIGRFEGLESDWKEKQARIGAMIGPALDAYFEKLGINPFEEGIT